MTDFTECGVIEQGRVPDRTNPKDLVGITKPPLHLVPPALVLWVSKVFQFSAYLRRPPYGPYNWRKNPVKKSIYVDAIERHLLALKDGEWLDLHKPDCAPDCGTHTGLPHVAQIGANVAIILDAHELGNLIDDMQWAPGPAPKIIAAMTETAPKKDTIISVKRVEDYIPKFCGVVGDPEIGMGREA